MGNRRIQMSFHLRNFRTQARSNQQSEDGQALRSKRSPEVEAVFGQIKHNQDFQRFILWWLEKTNPEGSLLCLAHNIKKLAVIEPPVSLSFVNCCDYPSLF